MATGLLAVAIAVSSFRVLGQPGVGLLLAFWLVRFLYKRKIFLRI